ncbi:MAG: DUF1002 domain-containing protein [Tissierellia bacterium]|nr:DUF1002 domain-containing protein [Tissierellia bacterium]
MYVFHRKITGRALTLALALLVIFLSVAPVLAAGEEGEVFVSLGQDLTAEERAEILDRLGASEEDPIVEVTNEEEHRYLGEFVPKENIGNRALSSAKVTLTAPGTGLDVTTSEHIFYITPKMYEQALTTAGITDAKVLVDGPGRVSGTAALTGIMKAYELAAGDAISEEQKVVANEELVVTSSLAEVLGNEEAAAFIAQVKQTMAENAPESREEVRNIVVNIAGDLNLNLTESQTEQVTDLFDNLRTLDVDWDAIAGKLQGAAEGAKEYLSSEEGQGLIRSIQEAVNSFFEWFAGLFQ